MNKKLTFAPIPFLVCGAGRDLILVEFARSSSVQPAAIEQRRAAEVRIVRKLSPALG